MDTPDSNFKDSLEFALNFKKPSFRVSVLLLLAPILHPISPLA
jgi:hypothetical protein